MSKMGTDVVCHIAMVVDDVEKVAANWAKIFGFEMPEIQYVPPTEKTPAFYRGSRGDYSDCKLAVFHFNNQLNVEMVQPGEAPSPWKETYEKNGGNGFQHMSFIVPDLEEAYNALQEIGAPEPYHVGYNKTRTYSFVDTTEQLGIEFNVKCDLDNTPIIDYVNEHPEKMVKGKEIMKNKLDV